MKNNFGNTDSASSENVLSFLFTVLIPTISVADGSGIFSAGETIPIFTLKC